MRPVLRILVIVATLTWPLAVYFGLPRFPPQALAAALAALIGLRLLVGGNRRFAPVGAVLLAFSLIAVWRGDSQTLRFYPVLANLLMLGLFGWTLIRPPPLIERLARQREPDLPAAGVRYTRRVTEIWCLFFTINGAVALYTALFCSLAAWTLYNGLISYLLMGLLFAVEFVCRIRLRRRHPS